MECVLVVECPNGHKMTKKKDVSLKGFHTAKVCPEGCFEFKNCRFNHDISKCYWCRKCQKHYQLGEVWSVS